MPALHGISLSIKLQPGSETSPEYTYVDGSVAAISSETGSTRLNRTKSSIAVYIASAQCRQFTITFEIVDSPQPPCHLFFKLFMNGRNITNWGVNPESAKSGSVARALFKPDDRWHLEEDGIVFRRQGIEARSFYFAQAQVAESVADDGGLIEVKVFRARGRRRRAPDLEAHRSHDRYGIRSPSEGLLDRPEDAAYFDYLLLEPMSHPFASFRFHYRSWQVLQFLGIDHSTQLHGERPSSMRVSADSTRQPEESMVVTCPVAVTTEDR